MLRMNSFVGKGLWEWLPGEADNLLSYLWGVRNLSQYTVRAYQADVKLFLDFAGEGADDWNSRCVQLFGTVFSQVVSELPRATHPQESGAAIKRPFNIPQPQKLFDLADLEPERILNSWRQRTLAVWRDAVMFKPIYAWGFRHNEARHLLLADFSRNVRDPFFGDWGATSRMRVGADPRPAGRPDGILNSNDPTRSLRMQSCRTLPTSRSLWVHINYGKTLPSKLTDSTHPGQQHQKITGTKDGDNPPQLPKINPSRPSSPNYSAPSRHLRLVFRAPPAPQRLFAQLS